MSYLIRSIDLIAKALDDSGVCPDTFIDYECDGHCIRCWKTVLEGVINEYEAKILQPNKDTTKEGKI